MLLTLKNIVAGYGNITALKGISLSVPEGKIVTLIGANGAGKSTTMKTIMGLMKPSEGEIRFKDKSITGQKSFHIVNAGVVLVPEGRQILQNMTVRENLELGAYQRKDKTEIREDMVKVFQRFPRLLERENQFGGTLSGGEQQMLAIARNYLKDNDEAEDAVQDVLLKLWQLIDTLRLPMAPLASVLLKNRCIDILRRHHYTTEVNETIPNEEEKADERYEKVIALIDTLPTMQQTIMRLRHMEGMEINDIAKLTGSKETAVRKALSRARHAIKDQFLKTERE